MRDGKLLFDDYGHFSSYGSDMAVRAYFPIVRRSLRQAGAARDPEAADAKPPLDHAIGGQRTGNVPLGAAPQAR